MIKEEIKKCGLKPNCVSTQNESTETNYIAPVKVSFNPIGKLAGIFKSLRFEIVTQSENYIHGVATSLIFRFKDDVEFFYNQEGSELQFRSESRTGYSDLGVNRKRIQQILSKLKI
jgi:uncharacterized protein (DUF1499 family)